MKEADRLQSLMDRLLTPHRLPQRRARSTSTRCSSACAALIARGVPAGLAMRRDYDTSLPSSRATGAAHPGDAQHRAQRRAGDRAAAARSGIVDHARRAPGDARAPALPPRGRGRDRGQRPGRAARSSRAHLLSAGVAAAKAAPASGLTLAQNFVSQHQRHDRVRERARPHALHDPAAVVRARQPSRSSDERTPTSAMKPVWIIDDDRSIRWVFEKALARESIAFTDVRVGARSARGARRRDAAGRGERHPHARASRASSSCSRRRSATRTCR